MIKFNNRNRRSIYSYNIGKYKNALVLYNIKSIKRKCNNLLRLYINLSILDEIADPTFSIRDYAKYKYAQQLSSYNWNLW